MMVFRMFDIPAFVMYCFYGVPGSLILIKSTNSIIQSICEEGKECIGKVVCQLH